MSLPTNEIKFNAKNGLAVGASGIQVINTQAEWVGTEQSPYGATGSQGYQGASGIPGSTGADGLQGATGADGQQGIDGLQGYQGATGIKGSTGADGASGISGATGHIGYQGATGLLGATGADGADGTDGASGPAGVQGATGDQGYQGATGDQGIDGASGAAGIDGASGVSGIDGASGAQGEQGVTGQQGATGGFGGYLPNTYVFDPARIGNNLYYPNDDYFTISDSDAGWYNALGSQNINTGNGYMFSFTFDYWNDTDNSVGIANSNTDLNDILGGNDENSIAYRQNGDVYYAGSYVTDFNSYSNGDTIDVAVDTDNHLIWFRVNNGYWNGNISNDPATGVGGLSVDNSVFASGPVFQAVGIYGNSGPAQFTINDTAQYGVPSGYTFLRRGITANTGYQGASGVTGDQGETGATGAQGFSGNGDLIAGYIAADLFSITPDPTVTFNAPANSTTLAFIGTNGSGSGDLYVNGFNTGVYQENYGAHLWEYIYFSYQQNSTAVTGGVASATNFSEDNDTTRWISMVDSLVGTSAPPYWVSDWEDQNSYNTTVTLNISVNDGEVAVLMSGAELYGQEIVNITGTLGLTWVKRSAYTVESNPDQDTYPVTETQEIWYAVNNTGNNVSGSVVIEYASQFDDQAVIITTWAGVNLSSPWYGSSTPGRITRGYTGASGATGYTGATGLHGARYHTTSSTNLDFGTLFTTSILVDDDNLNYSTGQTILITDLTHVGQHFHATVNSWDPGTKELNFTVTDYVGTISSTSWEINLDGAVGQMGASGATGIFGASGIDGPQGTKGTKANSTGSTGLDGEAGIDGASGADGIRGTWGDVGATGIVGDDGAQGINGARGVQGGNGSTYQTINAHVTSQLDNAYLIYPSLLGSYIRIQGPVSGIYPGMTVTYGGHTYTVYSYTESNNQYSFLEFTNHPITVGAIPVGADIVIEGYDAPTNIGHTGSIGASGIDGASGARGYQGATGLLGATGADGESGIDGASGADGVQGSTGAQGIDGASGASGIDGASGADGVQGATGSEGTQGYDGDQGYQGASGATGYYGATGAQGTDGSYSLVDWDTSYGHIGINQTVDNTVGAVLNNGGPTVTGSFSAGQETDIVTQTARFGSGGYDKVMFSIFQAGDTGGKYGYIGWADEAFNNQSFLGSDDHSVGFNLRTGQLWWNNTVIATGLPTSSTGDRIDVAIHWSAGLFWVRKNGGSWNGDPEIDYNGAEFAPPSQGHATPAVTTDGYQSFAIQYNSVGSIPSGFTFLGGSLATNVGYQGADGSTGATGPEGNAGYDADQLTYGNPRGLWDPYTTYYPDDIVVTIPADSHRCLVENTGLYPDSNPDYWQTTAWAGASGASGIDGASGPTGPDGATGIIGIDAATGPTGEDGATGIIGIDAATGVTGYDGATGATGLAGIDGASGVTGETGTDGATGYHGLQFKAAADGNFSVSPIGTPLSIPFLTDPNTGNNTYNYSATQSVVIALDGDNYMVADIDAAYGSSIDVTVTKSVGNASNQSGWVVNLDGAVGQIGSSGATGYIGATGYQGASGATGYDGASGIDGASGPTGQDGQQGIDGDSGIDGASGPTGEQGATGATGPAGIDGASGIQGASGSTGIFGATGFSLHTGSTGLSGTSQQTIEQFATNHYGTTKYLIQGVDADGNIQVTQVILTQNATGVYMTEYATLNLSAQQYGDLMSLYGSEDLQTETGAPVDLLV